MYFIETTLRVTVEKKSIIVTNHINVTAMTGMADGMQTADASSCCKGYH